MPTFKVFQQQRPKCITHTHPRKDGKLCGAGCEWESDIKQVGKVVARSHKVAMGMAAMMPGFSKALGLARYPMVEEEKVSATKPKEQHEHQQAAA